ncbi:MAG: hypothetical protein JOS17DRAFT_741220 [Linnemannia elongata]|nr:MAG: hypothetical protein JOS17DRAFT_741220 [Linnemannia elongata]
MVTPSKDISTETMAQIAKSKDNKYELLYFPFHGVLPALRAMFAMSGADYTFTHPVDWTKEKPTTPFGSLPVLYETDPISGHTLELAELSAIESYLGDKYGWMGDNVWERAQIQMYHSSTQAVFDKWVTTVVRAPKENKEQMTEIYMEKILPEWVETHERLLQGKGCNGHYVGDKFSIADLKTATTIDNLISISGERFLSREKTPAIFAVYDAVEKMPKYAAWKASSEWKAYDELNKKLFGF